MPERTDETSLLENEKTSIPQRTKLCDDRKGVVHTTRIGGKKIYVHTGEYENGELGEIFITLDKEGSELRVYDIVAIAISIGLQFGVPLRAYVDKFKHQQLEPSGITNNPEIPFAKSIIDYVSQWLEQRYCEK